jgi:hypothetical protein
MAEQDLDLYFWQAYNKMETTKSFMDVFRLLPFTDHFSFYHFRWPQPLKFLGWNADLSFDDFRSEMVERSEGIIIG